MVISNRKAAITFLITILVSIALGVLAHFLFKTEEPHEYSTIDEIVRFAKSLPEFPLSDDNDWLDPSYQSFNRSRLPSPLARFFFSLGIGPARPWSTPYLAHVLDRVTRQNRNNGSAVGNQSFVHIKSSAHTVTYVFGDAHGAFHSLVRDLEFLLKQGVLDQNLRILDENTYFVFNGDLIDRSPFSIESLLLTGTLMLANPQNVIYLCGKHERNSNWVDYGLSRELIDFGRFYTSSPIPYRELVNEFFETLPEAVYLSTAKSKNEVLRIAFNAQKDLAYDESELSSSFLAQSERVKIHTAKPLGSNEMPIDTRAVVKTEEWRSSNRIKKGLALLDQDQGATAWAVLSSPTAVHQVYLDFHYDAFAKIDLGTNVEEATITRIYQDTRKKDGYTIDTPLNMISAKQERASSRGIVKVASTMSLIRGVPTIGKQAKLGLDISVNRYNNHVDNREHLIRLYVDNDDYVPNIARANVQNFFEQKIPIVILPIGTPTTLSYMDLINTDGMLVLFPITGSSALRNPEFKNLVHFRATYENEVTALIKSLREDHGALKFAFLYQDDAFGRGPLKAAKEELSKQGITDVLALPYTRGSVDFSSQKKELQKNQPDALGFFATATATEEFIRQLGANSLANTKLFAISFAAESTLRKFANRHGLKFLFGAVVPNPQTSPMLIAKNYREAMTDANHDFDVFSFEAYIAANIFIYALEKLGDKPITARNVLTTLEAIEDLDFQGLHLDFDRKTRSLAQHVWLETGPDKDWTQFHIHKKGHGD